MRRGGREWALVPAGLLLAAASLRAEGMWTFDNPPTRQVEEAFGFKLTPAWLQKVRLASARFNDGGSGAFVSPEGLLLTNHHVGLGCIQNLSTGENDYVANGFLAPSRDREPACPGYEVNVLLATEDVSPRVLGAVRPAMSDKEAGDARKAAIARIEIECGAREGLRCNVVGLYQGGEYHLYRYRKYTDVRLVFAPEKQIAFFGGDPDNFTYPRHDLDVCLFRAYDGGRPVRPASYLKWGTRGTKEGDLVFVAGNPGSTSRLKTLRELESERDVLLPSVLGVIRRRLEVVRAYSRLGPENARRATIQVFGLENAQKAYEGRRDALADARAMAVKAEEERELRQKIAADPALAPAALAFTAIADARKKLEARIDELRFVGFSGSRLLGIAGQVVRYVVETRKPNEVRLKEYRDSNLDSLRNRLFSRAPIYDDLEQTTLAHQLELAAAVLGRDHPFVPTVLAGLSPAELAKEVVSGTRLRDPAVRRALVEGGPAAVEASRDPMIALARRIDPLAREIRRFEEDEVDAVVERAGQRIAEARFRISGKTVPPDATFTLRLSYGVVRGYSAEGTKVAPYTTFHGLYDRSASWGGRPPWDLPERWRKKKDALDLATPLNFVSTNDIIGGNSGSPVVNADGDLVGIVFDGNIHSLAWDYYFTDEKGRSVSVDSRAILEALRKVYEADALVGELTGS
jgi:hypothetical protein